jgi:hypothetical protein
MRHYFDFAFANPEKIKPEHAAILFYIIDLNNRLAWKEKFTLPTYTAMEALGIKRHQTFSKYLSDLIEWGYVIMVKKSLNQHIANVISLNSAMLKNDIADVKAHDKALLMHAPKHCEGTATIDRLSKTIETVKENKDDEDGKIAPAPAKRLPDYLTAQRDQINATLFHDIERSFLYGEAIPYRLEVAKDANGYLLAVQLWPDYHKKIAYAKISHQVADRKLKEWAKSCFVNKTDHQWRSYADMVQHSINFIKRPTT